MSLLPGLELDPFLGSKPSRALWRSAQIDPPWLEAGGGGRGAQNHYGLANVREIRRALLESGEWRPYPDAHLWCWYTDNFLQDALWLVDQLGFRYVRQAHWFKVGGVAAPLDFETGMAVEAASVTDLDPRLSLGQYMRSAHESLLFCVRGHGLAPSVRTTRRDVPSWFFAPVPSERGKRVHSRKPDAAYELIEAVSHGPHHEFFARRGRPGWRAWGNQAPDLECNDDGQETDPATTP